MTITVDKTVAGFLLGSIVSCGIIALNRRRMRYSYATGLTMGEGDVEYDAVLTQEELDYQDWRFLHGALNPELN